MIEIKNLNREFKVLNRKEGLKGAFLDFFSRDYRYIKAVKDINMTIEDGEIIGYVGPNGAGKSTTIKMLCGILQPTSGEITINGRNPYDDRREHMKKLGVVFGQRTQLWWSLPVIESFNVLRDIYSIDEKVYKNNLAMFDDLVHISELFNKPVRQMSLGQRMLCEVTAAFLHDPEVVFLDEPTIGLDVSVKDNIRKLIRHLNEEKKTTILLTSHDTRDIESLCKRVAIIDKGTKIFDGSLENLTCMFGQFKTIRLVLKDEDSDAKDIVKAVNTHFDKAGCKNDTSDVNAFIDERGDVLIVVNEKNIPFVDVMSYVIQKLKFSDISIEQAGVEEVIKKVYEGGASPNE